MKKLAVLLTALFCVSAMAIAAPKVETKGIVAKEAAKGPIVAKVTHTKRMHKAGKAAAKVVTPAVKEPAAK